MVNAQTLLRPSSPLSVTVILVRGYLAIVAATLLALAVLSAVAPGQTTSHAWGHAVVVSVLAISLPLRLRSARAGHRRGVRAVGLIAATLFLVNVVEALVPGFVPDWMQVQMWCVAALMLAVVLDVVRTALAGANG